MQMIDEGDCVISTLVQCNTQQSTGNVMVSFRVHYLLLCPAIYEVQICMSTCISNTREEKQI